jgi:hypothetical protein
MKSLVMFNRGRHAVWSALLSSHPFWPVSRRPLLTGHAGPGANQCRGASGTGTGAPEKTTGIECWTVLAISTLSG